MIIKAGIHLINDKPDFNGVTWGHIPLELLQEGLVGVIPNILNAECLSIDKEFGEYVATIKVDGNILPVENLYLDTHYKGILNEDKTFDNITLVKWSDIPFTTKPSQEGITPITPTRGNYKCH